MEDKPTADILIFNIGQIATPQGSTPRRGGEMNALQQITQAAIAIRKGRIVAVGPEMAVRQRIAHADREIDAGGKAVVPGFVDPHTHLIWAGERRDEFEMRLRGATYLEIMAAGGGIMNTVRATRAASLDELVGQSRRRLDKMVAYGTTTAEAKSGYGLTLKAEMKMLDAIRLLDEAHPVDLVPTFLGAHAVPEEYAEDPDAYVDLVVNEMIPAVAAMRYRDVAAPAENELGYVNYVPAAEFCDVFCERGAFTLAQSRRILQAAQQSGLKLKVHADEFAPPLGATEMAVSLQAVSVDHIVSTTPEQIKLLAHSSTIGVSLPGTPFGLGQTKFTPARQLIDAGGALAIATDLNPGTCWSESMQFMMALACRAMRITPAEALTAATLNAAFAIGRGRWVGSLEVGKIADLLILDSDDYRDLAYHFGTNLVEKVFKQGKIVG